MRAERQALPVCWQLLDAHDFDAVIHRAMFDIADTIEVRSEQLLDLVAVRNSTRRLPSAREDDLRPVRLDLRRRLACEEGVKLIARSRAFGLIDGHGLIAIREARGPAQKNIHQLVLAQTDHRASVGHHRHHVATRRSHAEDQADAEDS